MNIETIYRVVPANSTIKNIKLSDCYNSHKGRLYDFLNWLILQLKFAKNCEYEIQRLTDIKKYMEKNYSNDCKDEVIPFKTVSEKDRLYILEVIKSGSKIIQDTEVVINE